MVYFGTPRRTVAVAVERPDLVDAVRNLFRPSLVPEVEVGDAGSTGPVARVGGRAGAWELTRPGTGAERFETLSELLGELEPTILAGLLAGEPDATHLHAAGAVAADGALLALGRSGAGKSNLALAWARAGLPLLGDDAVLMDPDGRVRAVPRLMKIEQTRLSELGVEPESTVAYDPTHPEVWIDAAERSPWAGMPAIPRVIAGVRFDGEEGVRSRRLEPTEGLTLLLGSVLPSGRTPEESVDRFVTALEEAVVFEVHFGRSDEAARWLQEAARG